MSGRSIASRMIHLWKAWVLLPLLVCANDLNAVSAQRPGNVSSGPATIAPSSFSPSFIVVSAPAPAPAPDEATTPHCYRSTDEFATDIASLSRFPRYVTGYEFVFCPNTRYVIHPSISWTDNVSVEGTDHPIGPIIRPFHSNCTFLCGSDGSPNNNCIFEPASEFQEGGQSYLISIGDLNSVTGVSFKGFTIRGFTTYAVKANGRIKGSDFSFVDCIFEDNNLVISSFGMKQVSFDRCHFEANGNPQIGGGSSYTPQGVLSLFEGEFVVNDCTFLNSRVTSIVVSGGSLSLSNSSFELTETAAAPVIDMRFGTVYLSPTGSLLVNEGNVADLFLEEQETVALYKSQDCSCIFQTHEDCMAPHGSSFGCDDTCQATCIPFQTSNACNETEHDFNVCIQSLRSPPGDPNGNDNDQVCQSCKCTTCEGSFSNIGKGPHRGVTAILAGVLACYPVFYVLLKIVTGRQRWASVEDEDDFSVDSETPDGIKFELIVSGLSVMSTRFFVGLYVASATGSLLECFPDAQLNSACLADGYGWEAYVLGFTNLAMGILDWMTLMPNASALPYKSSFSGIRWRIISYRQCKFFESLVVGGLFMALSVVGTGGHIVAARDGVGVWLAVVYGIILSVAAVVSFCCLGPAIVVGFGICTACGNDDGESGENMKSVWGAYRTVLLDLPGFILTLITGNLPGMVGFGLGLWEDAVDSFLMCVLRPIGTVLRSCSCGCCSARSSSSNKDVENEHDDDDDKVGNGHNGSGNGDAHKQQHRRCSRTEGEEKAEPTSTTQDADGSVEA